MQQGEAGKITLGDVPRNSYGSSATGNAIFLPEVGHSGHSWLGPSSIARQHMQPLLRAIGTYNSMISERSGRQWKNRAVFSLLGAAMPPAPRMPWKTSRYVHSVSD